MRQVGWQYRGGAGCNPIVVGGVMVGLGIFMQTGWAEAIATFLVKALGFLLIGLGGLTVLTSLAAWASRRRGGPPADG